MVSQVMQVIHAVVSLEVWLKQPPYDDTNGEAPNTQREGRGTCWERQNEGPHNSSWMKNEDGQLCVF